MCSGELAPGAKSAMELPWRSASKNCHTARNFHELRGFALHLFHVVEKLERARVAIGERLFEIAAEAEMSSEEHEGIDVAPELVQIRDVAHFAIEVRDRRESAMSVRTRGERVFARGCGDGRGRLFDATAVAVCV